MATNVAVVVVAAAAAVVVVVAAAVVAVAELNAEDKSSLQIENWLLHQIEDGAFN